MAPISRQRQSASGRVRVSTMPENAVVLPPYQAPKGPLNRTSIHSLETLPMKHNLNSLKEQLKKAQVLISEVAADINEISAHRQASIQAKKEQRANRDPDATGLIQGEEDAEALRENVAELTKLLEEKTRVVIDVQSKVEAGEVQRRDVAANVAAGDGRVEVPATQSTLGASQFRARRSRPEGSEDEENTDGDEDGENEGSGAREQVTSDSILKVLKRKAEDAESAYTALSMSDRYAKHNDYIGFKKFVHDAQYPGEEKPPLPHASTWFDGSTVNHGPAAQENTADADASSDIEAMTERVSIKCPLTLLPMKQPVTSQKCPHSFEQDAITEMINHSSLRIGEGGRRGARDGTAAIKCPVCEIVLTIADLKPDPALKRRIEGIQKKERREQEESDDEDEVVGARRSRPEEVDSGDEMPVPSRSTARKVKSEQLSGIANTQNKGDEEQSSEDEGEDSDATPQTQGRPSRGQPPQGSAMVVDMEDEDDEEMVEDDQDLYE